MNFWQKNENKTIKSEEFELISKKIVTLEAAIDTLRHKNILLETDIADVRTKVIKKLNWLKRDDEETQEDSKNTKNFNSLNPFALR